MAEQSSNIIFFNRDAQLNDTGNMENIVSEDNSCNEHCLKCFLYPNRNFSIESSVKFEAGFLYTNKGTFKLSYSAGRALCLLHRNIDEFVSKEHIMEYVWGSLPRVQNNVNVVVSELRTALMGTSLCILNQRKVGYMLTRMDF